LQAKPPEFDMTTFSLIALPADHLRELAARRPVQTGGGGSAWERDLALAVALVAMAAALVLTFAGA